MLSFDLLWIINAASNSAMVMSPVAVIENRLATPAGDSTVWGEGKNLNAGREVFVASGDCLFGPEYGFPA